MATSTRTPAVIIESKLSGEHYLTSATRQEHDAAPVVTNDAFMTFGKAILAAMVVMTVAALALVIIINRDDLTTTWGWQFLSAVVGIVVAARIALEVGVSVQRRTNNKYRAAFHTTPVGESLMGEGMAAYAAGQSKRIAANQEPSEDPIMAKGNAELTVLRLAISDLMELTDARNLKNVRVAMAACEEILSENNEEAEVTA